jgi:CheY-like chemotaxis protein
MEQGSCQRSLAAPQAIEPGIHDGFSARPIDALRRAASAVGAKAILQKPCNAADLFSALQRAFKASATTYG